MIPTLQSQRDIRWSWRKLGTSGLTMGGFGCTTTVAARFCSWVLQRNVTPGELNVYLNKKRGYNAQGNIIWHIVCAFTKFRLAYVGARQHAPTPDVDYAMRIVKWGKYLHFVGVMPANKIFDPYTGKVEPLNQSKWVPLNDYRYFKKA